MAPEMTLAQELPTLDPPLDQKSCVQPIPKTHRQMDHHGAGLVQRETYDSHSSTSRILLLNKGLIGLKLRFIPGT